MVVSDVLTSWGQFLESPEKPFVKLRPAYSVKLVFSYVVKGITIKITAKFRASRRLRFEDTERIMSPEMPPKKFGTFEKWVPEQKSSSESYNLFYSILFSPQELELMDILLCVFGIS